MRFSRRYGYSNAGISEVILEDAPDWLRMFYIDGILDKLMYIDDDSRFDREEKPLGIKELYVKFCYHIRIAKEEKYWDSAYCWDILTDLIKSVPWYNFYDFVEFVGAELRSASDDIFGASGLPEYTFESYRKAVNEFFEEANVGYRLNEESELHRQIPEVLKKRIDEVQKKLKDQFEPARHHYLKAVKYLYDRPVDAENSIKEIVSAIESVGRIIYPGAATLGNVIKQLRNAEAAPPLLISVIEKFYAYASAEPAIRHGGPVESKVVIQDAEFSLHTGIAIIRYLIFKHQKPTSTN